MTGLESLVEHYGYAALFVGALLEGETILLLAGLAAHRGYLALPWVLVIAFAGAWLGDQLWFYVGRRRGSAFVARRQRWAARAQRLRDSLARRGWLVVVGFRFAYGLRTITPLVLGASGYAPRRFALLNLAGAAIWTIVVGLGGYLFGHALTLLVEDVKRYEAVLFGLLALGGLVAWTAHQLRSRRRPAPPPPGDAEAT